MSSDHTEKALSGRRAFLQASGMGLAYAVGTQTLLLSPAQAYAKQLPYTQLSDTEVETLELLADAIVPGARAAGVAHYIDSQLTAPVEDCLLMIRYLGVPAPYNGFYQTALQSIHQLGLTEYKKTWREMSDTQRNALTDRLASGSIDDWQGPPPGFFFFVLRADASDVVYGTQDGHEAIGFPHMAHIKPKQEW